MILVTAPVRVDTMANFGLPSARIHGLPKHIKRNAERYPKEILFGMKKGFFIYRAPEHGNDLVTKDQINDTKNKAAQYSK